jgi:hypothetical protein
VTNLSAQNFLKLLKAQPCLFQVAAEKVAPNNCHEAVGGHATKNHLVCLVLEEEYFLGLLLPVTPVEVNVSAQQQPYLV